MLCNLVKAQNKGHVSGWNCVHLSSDAPSLAVNFSRIKMCSFSVNKGLFTACPTWSLLLTCIVDSLVFIASARS